MKLYFRFINLVIFILLQILTLTCVYAQTERIDSLRSHFSRSNGSEKLKLALSLCMERNSMPADTLWKYIHIADSINKIVKDERCSFDINYYKACFMQISGNIDSAFILCTNGIFELEENNKYPDLKRRYQTYKGGLLIRNDKIKEAIALYINVLKESEEASDTINIIAALNGIGWSNMELSNFNDAVIWLKKAESVTNEKTYYTIYPLSNLAATYNSLHKNDSALYYINKALGVSKQSGDLKALANIYAIKSDILLEIQDRNGAEEMLRLMLDTRKIIGDQFYIASDMYQLGDFYFNTQQCEKGVAICKEGIAIASTYNFSSKLIILYQALAANLKACNQHEEYGDVLSKLIILKDSLYKINSADVVAEMQTKYEVEKKEKIILKQELTLARRNYLIFGSLLLFALSVIITILLFKQYKNKQKNIAQKEVLMARENERKRIAAELHDNIGTQLSYISRKIEYINADNSGLSDKYIQSMQDISSSSRRSIADLRETIWALKKENINIHDLSDRFKAFIKQQLSNYDNVHFHIEEKIDVPVFFSSIVSLNIFRILQEAVHNALQHSGCNNLSINITCDTKSNWLIEVKDDGKGFDPKLHYDNHFGLENMLQRASETGLQLEMISNIGNGTIIKLKGNAKNA